MAYDENTVQRVRRLLASRRDVAEKKIMGGLSFMIGGNMACSVSGKDGMLVRVGADGMDAALREPHASRMKMGARMMSGFVRVAPEGYRTHAAFKRWVQRGVAFAETLPRKKEKAKRPVPSRTRRGPG